MYKDDATSGKSVLNPRKYKGDVLVQVWLDSRVLATLSNWLDSEGCYTRFMSEIVKETLATVVESISESKRELVVDSTHDARTLLERKYRVNLNPGGRGRKNELHNRILTDRRQSAGNLNVTKRGRFARGEIGELSQEEAERIANWMEKTHLDNVRKPVDASKQTDVARPLSVDEIESKANEIQKRDDMRRKAELGMLDVQHESGKIVE